MKLLPALLCLSLASCSMFSGEDAPKTEMAQTQNFHSFQVSSLEGQPVNLADYKGKVVLVVNTASYSGFTPQYKGLEDLHARYRDRGLVVLGFPSNDFAQEKGSNREIADFCENTFGVKFPMFAASSVKGDQANPFFRQLVAQGASPPRWNFYKYLIGRDGKLIDSYSSMTSPDSKSLVQTLEKSLSGKPS